VPVECDYQSYRLVLSGVGEGLPNDLLMSEVHTVEETDGQADLAASRVEFLRGVDDSHKC
jgi:hypothetical protein